MIFLNKLLKSTLAFGIGFAAGFLAGFLHQVKFDLFISIYWGFIFSLILLLGLIRWSIRFADTKFAAVFYIPGWFLATYLLSTFTDSGDIVIANELVSQVYLGVSVLLLGIAAVWPVKS